MKKAAHFVVAILGLAAIALAVPSGSVQAFSTRWLVNGTPVAYQRWASAAGAAIRFSPGVLDD